MATLTYLRGVDRDLMQSITTELDRYPVTHKFGHGGKHPYVQIETRAGGVFKVPFSGTPTSVARAMLNTRTLLRRVLRENGVEPLQVARRAVKTGTLGAVLAEAAAKGLEPETIVTVTPPPPFTTNWEEDDFDDIALPVYPEPPLCPDAIRETCRPQPVASVPAPTAKPNGVHPMPAKPEPEAETSTTEAPKPKRAHLNASDATIATRLLAVNAEIDDAARTVTYRAGWSDERIQDVLAARPGREALNPNSVRDWRRREFGYTPEEIAERERSETRGGPVEAVNRRRLDMVERRMGEFERRLLALEEAATRPEA